jgi:hypothetical protein
MWLKVVSVYTVLRNGYDVLFQDADVIWWRDPRQVFYTQHDLRQGEGQDHLDAKIDSHSGNEETDDSDELYDAYFQNDGARSQRYSPFSANTGFYFLRSNPKTRYLMYDLLGSYNLISQWHSHQVGCRDG